MGFRAAYPLGHSVSPADPITIRGGAAVGERGSRLAAQAEDQIAQLVEFMSGLSEADLQIACPDDRGGSSVGSVAVHAGKGYGQAVRFLQALGIMLNDPSAVSGTQSQAYAMMHGGRGHGHDHEHTGEHVHNLDETITQLKADSVVASEVLRKLTDEQYSLIPPAIGTMSDGRKNLEQVVESAVEHQLAHLQRMQQACADARRLAEDPR
jgi:hypothetical protein